MRRLLAAALALCLAVPASAGRIRVIIPQGTEGSTPSESGAKMQAYVRVVLDRLGVEYDFLPQRLVAESMPSGVQLPASRLNQAAIRDSVYTQEDGNSRTYIGQIILGWRVGQGTPARMSGFKPDTLTRSATWPQIPTIFFGPGRVEGGSQFNSTATCTTGVRAGTSLTFPPTNAFQVSQYLVGSGLVWKGNGTMPYYDRAAPLTVDQTAPGITKVRLAIGSASPSYRTNGVSSCTDCDSMAREDTYATADTAIIWTRERSLNDRAPLIFAPGLYMYQSPTVDVPCMSIAMAIAIMDSASGGRIIGQKRGWTPLKMGILIENAFVHTDASNRSRSYYHGLECWSGNCDSTYLKAGIDSLKNLDVPVTIGVNVDSIASYPNEQAWWGGIPRAKFFPQNFTALEASLGVVNDTAGRAHPIDPFGMLRSRTLVSGARYESGAPCDPGDTTSSCLLTYARNILNSFAAFNGRMSAAMAGQDYNYIPSNFNRRTMPGADSNSVEAAMLRAGFRVGVINPMELPSSATAQFGISVSGVVKESDYSNPPFSLSPSYRTRFIGREADKPLGNFKWVLGRPIDATFSSSTDQIAGHPFPEEFVNGLFSDNWYPTSTTSPNGISAYYAHWFRQRLNVVWIRPADLGTRQAPTSNVIQPGWWYVKHVVNQVRALNAMAGRKIVDIVDVGEL
jgi:hypothetical protein